VKVRWFSYFAVLEASDTELFEFTVRVGVPDGPRAIERALHGARERAAADGVRVVDSCKAAGHWPLPAGHPNAPRRREAVSR